jgi:glutamate--cysteine ligase
MLAHLVESLQTLQQKQGPLFHEIKRGIERECLRTTPEGHLAPTPHSEKLGSKLTHPSITTDYSENLLEFITAPHTRVDSLLQELLHLHAFTAQATPEERLWPLSMPCILGSDNEIPIADYGTSHSGRMKMQYRLGLAHRYGRHMQCIAGLHYNFSLPQSFWERWYADYDPCHQTLQDCINANYMRLIRNTLKHAWLLFILMGASPACDASFFVDAPPDFLSLLPPNTYYGPHACSLRMSRLGYQSSVQDGIKLSYNALEHYIQDLRHATSTPSPQYQMITERHGLEAQLNANAIQIEAELYAPVRPKQVVQWGERPIRALASRGIEYIELRGIDINPLSPLGITAEQIHFLDTFVLFCLLHNSPTFTLDNAMQWHNNQAIAVLQGLSPDCNLEIGDRRLSANLWAERIFDDLASVAAVLDWENPDEPHAKSIATYRQTYFSRKDLLSAQQLEILLGGKSYLDYGLDLAEEHHLTLMNTLLPPEIQRLYEKTAQESLAAQQAMEIKSDISYEAYVQKYFE